MERNRDGRRTMAAGGDSLTRRRQHRTANTHTHTRDSPEEDGETTRLRDRVKKDRLGRTKNRRAREEDDDVGEYTSDDESFNDEALEDEDHKLRMLPLNPHRKTFPSPASSSSKVFRPAPPPSWKPADEMIGVSVPRKARSASTKRSHEFSGGIVAEQIHRQPLTSAAAAPSPASPSSSNLSVRKKIVKPSNNNNNGHKFKLLKSSSPSSFKASSSAQNQEEEIEIEIAEVLYGMMTQPQPPLLNQGEGNKSESFPPQNSSSDIIPMSVVAPKRKRPRQVKYDEESQSPGIFTVRGSPISTTAKVESDHPSKVETCSQNFDENTGSVPENGAVSCDLASSRGGGASLEAQAESIKVESNVSSHSKMLTEESEKQDVELSNEVVTPQSPNKESPKLDVDREVVKSTKSNLTLSECVNQREQKKFQIDLMAPPPLPPLLRSSPERNSEINFVAGDPKPLVPDADMEVKPVLKEGDKSHRTNKEEVVAVEMDEAESQKPIIKQKERGIDFQLDLEKGDKAETSGNGNIVIKKQHQNSIQKQQQLQQPNSEKNVVSNSVPLPLSVPNWPGGLPPMGYMTTLPGVVSVDGTTVTSAAIPPPHLLFNQPRPKRCSTHCYIARNILYHQQIAKMNPFWPAAAGSASLYGAKPCNLNVVPSAELHANVPSRAPNPAQDKDHGLAMFPGHMGKDKVSQPTNVDNSQRKQVLLQQTLPPGTPSNILGPAFIFPLNQQHAAAAAAPSVRPGSMKSLPVTSNGVSSFMSNSAPQNASGTGVTVVPPMSFSYPNMAGNETQYLAILQNNAYSFPIPAHVGGPPTYGGTHTPALPFFNGSFYSSQMLHPSQIQQQPQPQQQTQQGHHASISSGSSSSQKHVQNQQQKPNASGSNGGVGASGGSMQGSPVTKNHSSRPLQLQQQHQRQQVQNHHASHPSHQIESEMGSADSPSADSRLTRATMSMYGQNFAMPVQTPNFALMTPASISGTGSNGSHGEKKLAQEHPGPKAAAETSQPFAMSFASINGATSATGLDPLSIAHSHHSIMQNHHNYQIMAAAQAASVQQKKNYRVIEEGKNAVDSSNLDEDRKAGGKIPATVGQSIAFSRSDAPDPSTALTGNNVVDSSARTLGLGSGSINTSVASSQQHMQRSQQQIIQLQKQNQFAAVAAARSKTPLTSNGIVYSDHHPSTSSMNTKFSNAVSMFPQNIAQSSSTVVAQSPQWKNSARATTSQFPSSMASTPSSSVKTLPQQQARSQQAHTQISFSANPKSTGVQVQPLSSTQSPSPPVIVGSPTTSSISKNTGSPRTTSTSTDNKISKTSVASQQSKNSQAGPSSKSGRNMPSILSGPQLTTSSTGTKLQLPQQQQQQQQQQQISKQTLPHAQLFMSNPYYIHSQVSQSNSPTSTTSAASGYYLQRHGGGHDQMQTQMHRQISSGTNSNAAAASNTKGSGLPTPGLPHPAQFATMSQSGNHHQFVVPAGYPYAHAVPAAVQVKPAEQKQPAGE